MLGYSRYQEIRDIRVSARISPRLLFLAAATDINPQLQKARKPNGKFDYHFFLSDSAGSRG
jgi:hypothetical protein